MLGRAVGRLFSLAFPVDYEPDPSQSVKALARAARRRAARLPLRPHDRGRRQRRSSRCSATTSTTARSSRAGRCCSTRTRERALRRRRARDDDLGLQQLDLPPHPLGARPHQGRAGAAGAGGAQAHRRAGRDVRLRRPRRASASGAQADLNVIDFDNLTIQAPYTRADLPTGASRILQPSTGYLATMVNGEVVRRHDEDTGARPGRPAPQRPRATADGRASTSSSSAPASAASAPRSRSPAPATGSRSSSATTRPMPRRRRGRVRVGPHAARRRCATRTCSSGSPARSSATGSPTCSQALSDLGVEPRADPQRPGLHARRGDARGAHGRRRPAHAPVPAHHVRVGHAPHRARRAGRRPRARAAASPASSSTASVDGPPTVTGVRARGRHGARRRPRGRHHRPPRRRARVARRARHRACPRPSSDAGVVYFSRFYRSDHDEGFGFRGGFGAGLIAGVIGSDAGTYSITAVVDRDDKELRAHLSDSDRFDATMRLLPELADVAAAGGDADPPGALHDRADQPHPLVHRRRRRRRWSPGCVAVRRRPHVHQPRLRAGPVAGAAAGGAARRRARPTHDDLARRRRAPTRQRAPSRSCPGTTSRCSPTRCDRRPSRRAPIRRPAARRPVRARCSPTAGRDPKLIRLVMRVMNLLELPTALIERLPELQARAAAMPKVERPPKSTPKRPSRAELLAVVHEFRDDD